MDIERLRVAGSGSHASCNAVQGYVGIRELGAKEALGVALQLLFGARELDMEVGESVECRGRAVVTEGKAYVLQHGSCAGARCLHGAPCIRFACPLREVVQTRCLAYALYVHGRVTQDKKSRTSIPKGLEQGNERLAGKQFAVSLHLDPAGVPAPILFEFLDDVFPAVRFVILTTKPADAVGLAPLGECLADPPDRHQLFEPVCLVQLSLAAADGALPG